LSAITESVDVNSLATAIVAEVWRMPDLETSSTVCETDSNTDSDDSESDDDNTKLYCFCQKRNYTHFLKYRLIT